MKKSTSLFIQLTVVICLAVTHQVFPQANETLSNLTSPTSVNQSLIPSSTNTKSLGSSTAAWKDGWFMGKLSIGSTTNPSSMLEIQPPANSSGGINLKPNVGLIPSTSEIRFSELSANGSNYVGFKAPSSISSNKIWILPAADGTSGQVLSTNGSGALSWTTISGGISGLTTNFIPRWNGSALTNGSFYDDGINVGLGTTTPEADFHIVPSSTTETPFKVDDPSGSTRFEVNEGDIGGISVGTSTDAPDNGLVVSGQTILGLSTLVIPDNVDLGVEEDAYFKAKIGIGTTSPSAKFHIATSSTTDLVRVESAGGTPRLFVSGAGQVAVNTATPTTNMELSVNGDVYASSQMFINATSGSGKLNIGGGNSETVSIEGTSPYIKLKDGSNGNVFVQASGSNLRLGTLADNSTGKLVFRFNGSDKNAMDASGKLGLGTTTPGALLHLSGSNELLRLDGSNGFLDFMTSGVQKAFLQSSGNDLKVASNSGNVVLGNNVSGDVLYVVSNGTVGIGTSDTKGYKLGVDGNIVCEELKVKNSVNWPDFVFDEKYNLNSIDEMAAFIDQNNHLPGIPSAIEMHENGVEVGEMQKKLLQKIEELSLYIIDLKKQNDLLSTRVGQLENH